VLDGYISAQSAKDDYGVIITPSLELDSAATAERRGPSGK